MSSIQDTIAMDKLYELVISGQYKKIKNLLFKYEITIFHSDGAIETAIFDTKEEAKTFGEAVKEKYTIAKIEDDSLDFAEDENALLKAAWAQKDYKMIHILMQSPSIRRELLFNCQEDLSRDDIQFLVTFGGITLDEEEIEKVVEEYDSDFSMSEELESEDFTEEDYESEEASGSYDEESFAEDDEEIDYYLVTAYDGKKLHFEKYVKTRSEANDLVDDNQDDYEVVVEEQYYPDEIKEAIENKESLKGWYQIKDDDGMVQSTWPNQQKALEGLITDNSGEDVGSEEEESEEEPQVFYFNNKEFDSFKAAQEYVSKTKLSTVKIGKGKNATVYHVIPYKHISF